MDVTEVIEGAEVTYGSEVVEVEREGVVEVRL
jgi:hypothetical protein